MTSKAGRPAQLQLIEQEGRSGVSPRALSAAFDPGRLLQARRLAGLTKKALAAKLGLSAAAVGQWEAGATAPRPDHLLPLAACLHVEPGFFAAGRPYARLESSQAHFRSLRRTPATSRAKAVAYTEQVWELVYALEKRIQLPPVDLGTWAPEQDPDEGIVRPHPAAAARALREQWGVGPGPISKLVRLMEHHGIIVTMVPFAGEATATVDAFSTSALPRPVVVLTPDRADDVYRHRFTAAHELGHLVMHAGIDHGDPSVEREADAFAAEFLTPEAEIVPLLPDRMDLHSLDQLSQEWGVSVDSLVYRCKEVGTISESAYRRAFQRLQQLRRAGFFAAETVHQYPGEMPVLLTKAFDLAAQHGLSERTLADELKVDPARVRLLLGFRDSRPQLRLV